MHGKSAFGFSSQDVNELGYDVLRFLVGVRSSVQIGVRLGEGGVWLFPFLYLVYGVVFVVSSFCCFETARNWWSIFSGTEEKKNRRCQT